MQGISLNFAKQLCDLKEYLSSGLHSVNKKQLYSKLLIIVVNNVREKTKYQNIYYSDVYYYSSP